MRLARMMLTLKDNAMLQLATAHRAMLVLCVLTVLACGGVAQGQGPLITREQAASKGLERAWFAQVAVDPARSRVTTWYLYYDAIYSVTDSGVVTALNSETGEQLWTRQVGTPGHPAFGPGANNERLGIVSGSKLYILNRKSGRLEWVRELGSAPSSGPALSSKFAFVALVTGRIEGYDLLDPVTQPWYYQSSGRTFLRPTVTGRVVSWPTNTGILYVGRADNPGILFRLETNGDIVTSPAQKSPNLYITSLDGYLYCVNELTGVEKWRYSTGYSITSSPAVVENTAFVASFEPALHAVDAVTGDGKWIANGVSHFAALGKERVYASDQRGNLLILEAATGRMVGRLPVAEGTSTLVNYQTDRIFLVSDRGLVQCLHEIGATVPASYSVPVAPPIPKGAKGAAADDQDNPVGEEAGQAKPDAEGAPAGEPDAFGGEDAEDEAPADDEPMSDNPFEDF